MHGVGKKDGAYFPWDKDDEFPVNLAQYFDLPVVNVPRMLEGGAIICDGMGSIFTTQSVLLNRNRNPFKAKTYIEDVLKRELGAKKVVWLKQGLATDETNGHVDNILSVVSENEICITWTNDKKTLTTRGFEMCYLFCNKNIQEQYTKSICQHHSI